MDELFDPSTLCMNCMRPLETAKSVCPHCGFNNASVENAAHQLECGSILAGAYLVGRVLGQGGFGITYVGIDLNLQIKVAIKEYFPEGCVSRDMRSHSTVLSYNGEKEAFFCKGKERFVDEARTLALFAGDDGIVHVRSFFYENGTAYIVMDYAEGETLKSYAAKMGGMLPADEVFALFEPLLCSIARVHEAGLLHRDISPDNIVLRPDGTLVLLDFGAARQMSVAGEHSNTISVKHGFAPEEQYRTRGEQGPWTDIYALCATIYRLITGILPPQALDRLMNGDVLKRPSELGIPLSERRENALMKGMAVRTNERTQTIRELLEQFYGEGSYTPEPIKDNRNALVEKLTQATGAVKRVCRQAVDFLQKKTSLKRQYIVAGLCVCAAAVLTLTGFVWHGAVVQSRTRMMQEFLYAKNFEGVLDVARKISNHSNEYDEVFYASAEQMLISGELEAAEAMLARIHAADRFDVAAIEDGIVYQRLEGLLASGEYADAEAMLSQIRNPERFDIASVNNRIAVLRIEDQFSVQQYLNAVGGLKSLIISSETDAANILSRHRDELYQYAVEQFRLAQFERAFDAFAMTSGYERTDDYLFVLELEQINSEKTYTFDQFERMMTMTDFENVPDLLVRDNDTAFRYMLGDWYGDVAEMHFCQSGENRWGTWDIAGIPRGQYSFQDGDLYVTNNSGETTKAARITVLGRNSIELFVYANERTFHLTRS